MTEESQQDRCASRRALLLGVGLAGACGALAGCSTAAVPYDANEAGQAPGAPAATGGAAGDAMAGGAGTGVTGANAAGAGGAGSGGAAGSGAAGSGGVSSGGAGSGGAGGGVTGTLLAAVAEIPVGGGKVFAGPKVVVTQPVKGQFKAFSAVCTHVGCVCNAVTGGTINCPCHGAQFKISDGSVVAGPATSPLPARTIAVAGGKILLQ
jgi:Rieske Fe-S protein